MRNPALTVALACSALALGCSPNEDGGQSIQPAESTSTKQAAPAFMPPPRTAASDFRNDGGLVARHQHIVDEARKGGNEIAFIGDSITEGWGGAGKDLWSSVWAPRHAVNCGIGGDRTQHVIGRLEHDLLDALAAPNNNIKWIVLMIGTNNTGDDTATDIETGIEAIVKMLRSRLPNAQFALFAVFPRGQHPNPLRDKINEINTQLKAFAAKDPSHLHLVDIGGKFLKADGELPADIMPDFLHLSPAGYKIWSDELQNVIK